MLFDFSISATGEVEADPEAEARKMVADDFGKNMNAKLVSEWDIDNIESVEEDESKSIDKSVENLLKG